MREIKRRLLKVVKDISYRVNGDVVNMYNYLDEKQFIDVGEFVITPVINHGNDGNADALHVDVLDFEIVESPKIESGVEYRFQTMQQPWEGTRYVYSNDYIYYSINGEIVEITAYELGSDEKIFGKVDIETFLRLQVEILAELEAGERGYSGFDLFRNHPSFELVI